MRTSFSILTAILLASCGQTGQERELERLSNAAEDAAAAVDNVSERMFVRNDPADLGIMPPGTSPEYLAKSVFETCKRQSQDTPGGEAACKKNAETGSIFTGKIAKAFVGRSDVQAMIEKCIKDYTESEVTDFALVGGCVRNGRGIAKQ